MRTKPAYQLEPDDSIRSAIWSAGEITPLQLFRIAAWKSARGLAPLSLNSEAEIQEVTRQAVAGLRSFQDMNVLQDDVDWLRWSDEVRAVVGSKRKGTGFLALRGVEYPMASAILAYLAPRAFPVIDKWAVLAIFGEVPTGRWRRAVAYARFTERLCELAPAHYPGCSNIHQVDQAVMNAIMDCDEPREGCTHVPFPTIELPT